MLNKSHHHVVIIKSTFLERRVFFIFCGWSTQANVAGAYTTIMWNQFWKSCKFSGSNDLSGVNLGAINFQTATQILKPSLQIPKSTMLPESELWLRLLQWRCKRDPPPKFSVHCSIPKIKWRSIWSVFLFHFDERDPNILVKILLVQPIVYVHS